MDYAYAVKTLPQPDSNPAAGDPAAAPPPEPQPPGRDDARPWAGDVYDEGDETEPAQAHASFSGQNGEQAWLDKAEDGTLTGWVRDETGQVWRYSDADAWAIDVDDAEMAQTGGTQGAPPAEGGEGQAPDADPALGDPAADAPPLDFAPADDVTDPADTDEEETEGEETDPSTDEPADDGDLPEEDEEEGAKTGKGKKSGKAWA